jgi:hypothetical protein
MIMRRLMVDAGGTNDGECPKVALLRRYAEGSNPHGTRHSEK